MASITPHKDGYRVQVKVGKERHSLKFRTMREAKTWGATREAELRAAAGKPESEKHTVGTEHRHAHDDRTGLLLADLDLA
jgi:hypothetical protein